MPDHGGLYRSGTAMSQGRPSTISLMLATLGAVVLVAGLVAWIIYQAIWGFGGIYTIRYLPVPEDLIFDSIGAPGGDFTVNKRNRVYAVRQSVEEMVQYYQETLPRTGWTIRDQGAFPSTFGVPGYCFIVEQRGLRVDIWMAEVAEDPITRVFTNFDDPSLCDYQLRRQR